MSELKYRMILVGGLPAGILGLDELIKALIDSGSTPADQDLGDKLIDGVRRHNFIPKPAVVDYRQALLREFQNSYSLYENGERKLSKDYGLWEGHPREHIPWFPSIAPQLCNDCGKCIEVCPKDVFAEDESGHVAVVEPVLCIVGCCFCKSACDPQAILMPKREILDHFRFNR
jgi:NAD-dependent dihydropyrimidine dehydrogenase PreA subunit